MKKSGDDLTKGRNSSFINLINDKKDYNYKIQKFNIETINNDNDKSKSQNQNNKN